MLAFAMHLLEQGAKHVELRPDGMHGKQLDFRKWFESEGFTLAPAGGGTDFAGVYSRNDRQISVSCAPGIGDVVATVNNRRIVAECKGGIINTRHAGQLSHLRKAVLEAVGQLMCREQNNDRHIVVLPRANETVKWAERIGTRAQKAGIEIALVLRDGTVEYIKVAAKTEPGIVTT